MIVVMVFAVEQWKPITLCCAVPLRTILYACAIQMPTAGIQQPTPVVVVSVQP
jgi:hypothetical protein